MNFIKKISAVFFVGFALFLTLVYSAGNNYIPRGSLITNLDSANGELMDFQVIDNLNNVPDEIQTGNGQVLRIEQIDEVEDPSTEVSYDVNNQILSINFLVDDGVYELVVISVLEDDFKISRGGYEVLSGYPMIVDENTGRISITTSSGNIILSALPDNIVYDALDEELLDIVDKTYLEEDSAEDNKLNYVLEGTKSEKFLGILKVKIFSKVYYSAQTGKFIKTDQPFFTKLLDLFSF